MKYIIPFKLFENESLPDMQTTWNMYHDSVQGLVQYFTKYWYMKTIHYTPSPTKPGIEEIEKKEGVEKANPFKYMYNAGESQFNIKLETDDEHDGMTYDTSCKICVQPLNLNQPYYKRNKITINMDIDGNVDNITNRYEQREFLLLKLLTIEKFSVELSGDNNGIISYLNELNNNGFSIILKLCPGFSKINPNLISRGISLAKITEEYFRNITIQNYTNTTYKLIYYFIYYNDEMVIKSWWDTVSKSILSIKVVNSISKNSDVYTKFKKIIGDDINAKSLDEMGFAD